MHPMFVKLFLETDADDLQADGLERRRRGQPGQTHPVPRDH